MINFIHNVFNINSLRKKLLFWFAFFVLLSSLLNLWLFLSIDKQTQAVMKSIITNGVDSVDVLNPHYKTILIYFSITFGAIAVGVMFIIYISKQFRVPLEYLTKAIKVVKDNNNYRQIDSQTMINSPIEIQQFIQSFNEMMSTIQQREEKLLMYSYTDVLTGVANRRSFEEYFEQQYNYAISNRKSLSIVLIDIDWFKEVNDMFGHQFGDYCIREIAHVIKSTVKDSRYRVARYGGEEFVMVLPNTSKNEVKRIAEKVRKQVESLRILRTRNTRNNNKENYMTVSIGIANSYPSRNEKRESMIASADMALYKAKNRGRNNVVGNIEEAYSIIKAR